MLHTSLLLTGSLVALAAAQGSSQCTSGEVVCCNMVQSVSHLHTLPVGTDSTVGHPLLQASAVPNIPSTTGMSNAAAASLGLVGSTCTTLTVIGLPVGKSCAISQIPVCCTDNNYVRRSPFAVGTSRSGLTELPQNGTVSLGCGYINNAPMQLA